MNQFPVHVHSVDPDSATRLWQEAPLSTVFTHPQLLAALSPHVAWWAASVRDQLLCLWPVCLDQMHAPHVPQFTYYLGPFWVVPAEPSARRRLLQETSVYQALLQTLSAQYPRLRFSLPPTANDMRPFSWFGHPQEKVIAKPRYTASVFGLQARSELELMEAFSVERRADARRAQRHGVRRLPACEFAQFDQLYRSMLATRGLLADYPQRIEALRAMWQLTQEGHGYVVAGAMAGGDSAQSIWLVLLAKGRACGIAAVATDSWRERQYNAWSCWQALLEAKARGADIYDFNGANSPQRGSDKLSFGSQSELYFDLQLNGEPPSAEPKAS
jgi:hypothetical protein